jgi:hypothetical protein
MFLLLLCLGTILAPTCQLSCSLPPSSAYVGAASFHPFSCSTTALTRFYAMAPPSFTIQVGSRDEVVAVSRLKAYMAADTTPPMAPWRGFPPPTVGVGYLVFPSGLPSQPTWKAYPSLPLQCCPPSSSALGTLPPIPGWGKRSQDRIRKAANPEHFCFLPCAINEMQKSFYFHMYMAQYYSETRRADRD